MPDYIEIPLTQGKFAKVDSADALLVLPYRWCAHRIGRNFYAVRNTARPESKRLYMHRVITGEPQGEVDHVNGDGLDNRRANLRVANQSQQSANQHRKHPNKTSRFKGVFLKRDLRWPNAKSYWCAEIQVENRKINLGRFDSEEAAAAAYDAAAKRLFGEFACPNVSMLGH